MSQTAVGTAFLLALAVGTLLWLGDEAQAQVPMQTISSAGPLDRIFLGNELSCQVAHVADPTDHQFYPPGTTPGDCGWFLWDGATFYAPDMNNHAGSASGGIGAYTPFTPVSQSAVTGAGTPASPFEVVTQVQAGPYTLTANDTYVVGQDYYTSWLGVTNTASAPASLLLWRAADCFLGGSDSGYGAVGISAPGSIACTRQPNNVPSDRFEEFIPLTPGSNYYHEGYSTVWSQIGGRAAFPDTCLCTTLRDNGAGLSWQVTLQPGMTTWIGSRLRFAADGQPTAAFNAVQDPCVSYRVVFDDLSAAGVGASIVQSDWDWGDGSPTQTYAPPVPQADHTYPGPGNYTVNLTVTDSQGLRSTYSALVTVVRCHRAPTLGFTCSALPAPRYNEVRFTLRLDDPDGVVVDRWWVLGGVGPVRPDPTDYVVPPPAGPFNASVHVLDRFGGVWSAAQTCAPTLNAPPVLAAVPDQDVMEGRTAVLLLDATDPQGDPLRFVAAGLPPGARFDVDTGVLAWTAPAAPAGPFTVTMRAEEVLVPGRDPVSAPLLSSVTQTFRLRVVPMPPAGPDDPDRDADGVVDRYDNCPDHFNDEQADADEDGTGDPCEAQATGGGREPRLWAPETEAPQAEDGAAAAPAPAPVAPDADGDGVADALDLCPLVPDPPQADLDGDGVGDACDADLDGDGVAQVDALGRLLDACPRDAACAAASGLGANGADATGGGTAAGAGGADATGGAAGSDTAGAAGAGRGSADGPAAADEGRRAAWLGGGAAAALAGAVAVAAAAGLALFLLRMRRSRRRPGGPIG